ncbi:MAG: hypothetical protein ACOX6D_00220 [Thermoguttaceae bacterium]|jgi:hypothetical protein
MKRFGISFLFFLWLAGGSAALSAAEPLKEIRTAPEALAGAESHVQGICCSEDAIFLLFRNRICKIDWEGNLVKTAEVQSHAGDPTYVDGQIFVSMSEPEGHAIFVFDEELNLTDRIKLEKTGAADGIAFMNGHFFVGGPSVGRTPHFENRVNVFDADFHLIREMNVNFGSPTHYGTQAIEAYDGTLLMAFYVPKDVETQTIRTDPQMNVLERYPVFAANGIALAPRTRQRGKSPRFLLCTTEYTSEKHPIAVLRWYTLKRGELVDITE